MMAWWWIGFHSDRLPKGQRSLGAAIVLADSWEAATGRALGLGALPSGVYEAIGGPLAASFGDPPPEYVGRLLTNAEATAAAAAWGGGAASPEDIEAAYSDDCANVGEPLFRRPP